MSQETDIQPGTTQRPPSALRIAVRLILTLGILAALLFLPAGRWNWTEAWIFLLGYASFLVAYMIWGLRRDPGQLVERSRTASNVKPWDKTILAIYTLLFLATLVLAGLDAGRFQWSSVPSFARGAAWLGLVTSGSLIGWAAASNTYLSRMARIQDDRGQKVVSMGPYRLIRHPMYLGIILLFLSLPPALGSYFGLIPAAWIGVLFVVRTSKEDTMLRHELAGYEEYARRVRFRVVPGIW